MLLFSLQKMFSTDDFSQVTYIWVRKRTCLQADIHDAYYSKDPGPGCPHFSFL